jgi:hypothetical protein
VRGPFKPVATSVPGLRLTEALPRIAQQAEHFAVLRSVHHTIRCHNPAIYCSLAGREATDPMAVSSTTIARRGDHPHYASVVARLRPGVAAVPGHVIIPDVVYNGPAKSPGQFAGYLGAAYDPFVLGADPSAENFRVEGLGLPADVERPRFTQRQSLLEQLDGRQRRLEEAGGLAAMDASYQKAFALLTSSQAKRAFDLSQEPVKLRDRYGRHTMGQGALLWPAAAFGAARWWVHRIGSAPIPRNARSTSATWRRPSITLSALIHGPISMISRDSSA